MRVRSVVLIAATLISGFVTAAVAGSPIGGTWSGHMTPLGSGLDKGYGFRVTIAADGRSGSWRLNVCGGRLVFLRESGGYTYFRERTTFGHDVCVGGGTDRVRRVDDELYVRFSSTKGKAYASAGTLKRVR
jgi:hypothetical protein